MAINKVAFGSMQDGRKASSAVDRKFPNQVHARCIHCNDDGTYYLYDPVNEWIKYTMCSGLDYWSTDGVRGLSAADDGSTQVAAGSLTVVF